MSVETHAYFRDVNDHAMRINKMVDNTRELLNSALEANFSLISISQNDTNKKFASWAAIIALPTMIAGFWGMNFKFMQEAESQYGFYAIIGLTVIACMVLFLLFRRSGWL
ncbi:MAG: CorA family divalent cation transporter [Agriterribacter sp.]